MFRVMQAPLEQQGTQVESLGSKKKWWFALEGESWLFKATRTDLEKGEHWSEKVACELAKLLAIPCAHYELAQSGLALGVATKNFLEAGEEKLEGNILLKQHFPEAEFDDFSSNKHQVPAVLEILRGATQRGEEQVSQFVGYLLLDAWIGNTDRHPENWALIKKEGILRLAPTYDHASSLGRELRDAKRQAMLCSGSEGVHLYCAKARSKWMDQAGKNLIHPLAAFKQAFDLNRILGLVWIKRLEAIPLIKLRQILEDIPESHLSQPSRDLALAILDCNRQMLLELL